MPRLALFVLLSTLSAGCNRSPDAVVVGSKNFSENIFLGELVAQRLEQAGILVERRLNLGGTFLCHQALLAGQIDLYPEYTGTALLAMLQQPPVKDPRKAFDIVQREYEERFQARWMPPFGFNNSFAILVRDSAPQDLRAISDLARYADRYVIGFNFEFEQREDGFRGLQHAYEFNFAKPPKTLDLNLVYQALAEDQIDVAVGNSTHGLIKALDLRILDDDRRYFPPYDAAVVVRDQTLSGHPGLEEILQGLGGALSQRQIVEINRRLDVDQQRVADVARDVLTGLPSTVE